MIIITSIRGCWNIWGFRCQLISANSSFKAYDLFAKIRTIEAVIDFYRLEGVVDTPIPIIKCVKYTKYLEAAINFHLKWYEYINITTKVVRETSFIFSLLRYYVYVDALRSLCFAYNQFVTVYGLLNYGSAANTNWRTLYVSETYN